MLYFQLGSAAGLLAILTVISMQSALYEWHTITDWRLWVGACVHPIAGFVLGYILAFVLRMSPDLQRTIAFETGCQNVALTMSVITLLFSEEIRKELIIYPILFGIVMPLEAVLGVVVYKIYKQYVVGDKGEYDTKNNEAIYTNGKTIKEDLITKTTNQIKMQKCELAIAASKVATKNGGAAIYTICNTKLNDIEKHCISQI